MEVLVLGAGGLLGSNVASDALARGWTVTGTYHSSEPELDVRLEQLDVTDTDRARALVESTDPDVVINCAAMTDVDGCEERPEAAYAVNAEAPGAIASTCGELGLDFVHVSTDYVFDGTSGEPYDESAEPNPIQAYGASKLAGDRAVTANHDDAVLARLSFVYGIHRSTGALTGFPSWVRGRLLDGETVPLFTDQHVTPSRAGQAAGTILDLVSSGASGLFNVASRSCVTPYEFGAEITGRMGVTRDLLEGSSLSAVDRPAERPSSTCLDVSRVESTLGRAQPTLEEDLSAIDPVFDPGSA